MARGNSIFKATLGTIAKYSSIATLIAASSLALGTGCNNERRPMEEEPDAGYQTDSSVDSSTDSSMDTSIDSSIDTSIPLPEECKDVDEDGYFNFPGCGTAVDCKDHEPSINPGAEEVCDYEDNNCDGNVDEFVRIATFLDNDGDGYGDMRHVRQECKVEEGWVTNSDDCNDDNPLAYPNAVERCDGVDNNCNTTIDEICDCTAGEILECGDYKHGTCRKGNQTCDENGVWGECLGFINPAHELCDGLDNDCDGFTDDGVLLKWYRDADGDTFGDARTDVNGNPIDMEESCEQPEGYVGDNHDCNDLEAGIHPGIEEICNEIDDDCNGFTDEGANLWWWEDADGDGYGNRDVWMKKCDRPEGYVNNFADCDDNDPEVRRGLPGYLDNDNDGFGMGEPIEYVCSGFWLPEGYAYHNGDCNDNDPSIHPLAFDICNGEDDDCDPETEDGVHQRAPLNDNLTGVCANSFKSCLEGEWQNDYLTVENYREEEICDEEDNNCDGRVDEGATRTFYLDFDGDSRGNAEIIKEACRLPRGYAENSTDCNDGNPNLWEMRDVHPNNDGDEFGANETQSVCAGDILPPGYLARGGDCNDRNSEIHPNAMDICDNVDNDCNPETADGAHQRPFPNENQRGVCFNSFQICRNGRWVNNYAAIAGYSLDEVCDLLDNDCNGLTDEGVGETFYRDADRDSHGNPNETRVACALPDGYVEDRTDCDDLDAAVHPLADEICNGTDDDCDEVVDENVKNIFYLDFDGDGRGNPEITIEACRLPPGYSLDNTDCNDNDANLWEIRDAHPNHDGDPFGADEVVPVCAGEMLPAGYLERGGDCDDQNSEIHPDAMDDCDNVDNDCNPETVDGSHQRPHLNENQQGVCAGSLQSCREGRWVNSFEGIEGYSEEEECDWLDNDCNGMVDENVRSSFYEDLDGDGQGNIEVAVVACQQPEGFVADGTDCDDLNARVWQILLGYRDADRDSYGAGELQDVCSPQTLREGYSLLFGDCDDDDAGVHPGARDRCNNIDDDCSVETEDGSGVAAPLVDSPVGVCINQFKLCENGEWVNNYARIVDYLEMEICDELDNNCDGEIDEGVLNTYFGDGDGDGYGTPDWTVLACAAPEGFAEWDTDCDDDDADINPGVEDICNLIDDDCDDELDEDVEICQKILFEDWSQGGYRMYVVDSEGNNLIENTPDFNEFYRAKWRPRSQKISFFGDDGDEENLWEMNIDGSGLERLTQESNWYGDYAWSPDGQSLAFFIWRNGCENLYTLNTVTGEAAQVTNHVEAEDDEWDSCSDPEYSPDGTKILFTCEHYTIEEIEERIGKIESGGEAVYVVDLNSRIELKISGEETEEASWQWDSSRIAYVTEVERSTTFYTNSSIGNDEQEVLTNLTSVFYPSYSPVEDVLAVMGILPGGSWNIFTIAGDGALENLTGHNVLEEWDFGPVRWSPDGQLLAYYARNGNDRRERGVYVLNVEDGNSINVTGPDYDPFEVHWSPLPEEEE